MKTSDLQIGDWVTDENGFPMYVVGLYGDDTVYLDFDGNEADMLEVNIKDVKPIPITSEILENNRFIKHEHPGYPMHYLYDLPCDGRLFEMFSMYDSDFSFHINGEARIIKDIHQLQHALRLCEFDKKIKL